MARNNQNSELYNVYQQLESTQGFDCPPLTTMPEMRIETAENTPKQQLNPTKRKCRRSGMNEQEIRLIIGKRNHTISELSPNDQIIREQSKQSNKRKRIQKSTENLLNGSIKSMSQLSVSQEALKRMKYSTSLETISSNSTVSSEFNCDEITFYKPSKYLKMPRKLLLYSLRLQLGCPLKKRKEQEFIFTRLTIMDQQFCLPRSKIHTYDRTRSYPIVHI